MIEVSMTTFVDFVASSGSSRLTSVRQAKRAYGEPYGPARDFYRPLREAIVAMHEAGAPEQSLDSALDNLTDPRKVAAYRECVTAYQRWCGQKRFVWVGTRSEDWQYGDLVIRVNPELGIRINGTAHVVKLYFKSTIPSKTKFETMFQLLRSGLQSGDASCRPAVLDVRRGKLIRASRPIEGIQALLEAEAAEFQTLWRRL